MKKFSELSPELQVKAVAYQVNSIIALILEGVIQFEDGVNESATNLQRRIDRAIAKAENMQTPWFAGSYILDVAQGEVEAMAKEQAEAAIYAEQTDPVIISLSRLV